MKEIKSAIVLHNGWEMDNKAWVGQDLNGELHLMTTSHGSKRGMTIEDLDMKIKETEGSLTQLKGLRKLVI